MRKLCAFCAVCLLLAALALSAGAEAGFVAPAVTEGQGTAGVPFEEAMPGLLPQPERQVTVTGTEGGPFEMKTPANAAPYGQNTVAVTLPAPGRVTVAVRSRVSTVIPENALTAYEAAAGTFSFSWPACVWNGEPLPEGLASLICYYTPDGGTEQTLERTVTVVKPEAKLLYAFPELDAWCPGTPGVLHVDLELMAGGVVKAQVVRKADQTVVFSRSIQCEGGVNTEWKWDGKSAGQTAAAGEYTLRFWSEARPEEVIEQPLTLLSAPEKPELSLHDPYAYPTEGGDEAVWAFLTSPVWVLEGYEGNGLMIRENPYEQSAGVGYVTCRTVGVSVLDLSVPGWARIGAYRIKEGAYIEGWVRRTDLTWQSVSTRMALVVDKASQRLTVWQAGHPLGTVYVSTGSQDVGGRTRAETKAGVFLTGTRMLSFRDESYARFLNVIRINGGDLIHSIGYARTADYDMDFRPHASLLGRKASHGCIRVAVQASDDTNGVNSWWIWTHAQRNTKVFIIEGE